MTHADNLYLECFLLALLVAAVATPFFRRVAMTFGILDHPLTDVKTHKHPTPYLGGLAVALGAIAALAFARAATQFPTGTLRSLRGMMLGGSLVLLLGLIDDARLKGLSYRFKFLGQIVAALCLVAFDIRIHFIHPEWLGSFLTVVWVVGITNAVNIIDVMDGLAAGIVVIASLGFFYISLPSEQIYVNFAATALAGALLGFMPYNFSKRLKIFLGDTGSLFAGFLLAALSLGTAYSHVNNVGVFAPILILGIPIYDTVLVTILRLQKGMSPFLGSLDHYALRLERYGFYRPEILGISYTASLILAFAAWEVTLVDFQNALLIYGVVGLVACALGTWLARIRID